MTVCPQLSLAADGFTGEVFSGWAVSSQNSYIETSVTMAGVVFTQTHPGTARCINDWYFRGAQKPARNTELRAAIAGHGQHHPSGVILAVLLKACPIS